MNASQPPVSEENSRRYTELVVGGCSSAIGTSDYIRRLAASTTLSDLSERAGEFESARVRKDDFRVAQERAYEFGRRWVANAMGARERMRLPLGVRALLLQAPYSDQPKSRIDRALVAVFRWLDRVPGRQAKRVQSLKEWQNAAQSRIDGLRTDLHSKINDRGTLDTEIDQLFGTKLSPIERGNLKREFSRGAKDYLAEITRHSQSRSTDRLRFFSYSHWREEANRLELKANKVSLVEIGKQPTKRALDAQDAWELRRGAAVKAIDTMVEEGCFSDSVVPSVEEMEDPFSSFAAQPVMTTQDPFSSFATPRETQQHSASDSFGW